MERNRVRRALAAITVVTALFCAPAADAKPTSPLCEDGSYRRAHPLICDTGAAPGPPGAFPGGGSNPGGGGGLIGAIRRAIGGLL